MVVGKVQERSGIQRPYKLNDENIVKSRSINVEIHVNWISHH